MYYCLLLFIIIYFCCFVVWCMYREHIHKEKVRRDPGGPSSWLCQYVPRICMRGGPPGGYVRVEGSESGAPRGWGAPEAPGGPSSPGGPPAAGGPPPQIIGRGSNFAACAGTGLTSLFQSTSLEGIRRRRGPQPPAARGPQTTIGAPLTGSAPVEAPTGIQRDGIELRLLLELGCIRSFSKVGVYAHLLLGCIRSSYTTWGVYAAPRSWGVCAALIGVGVYAQLGCMRSFIFQIFCLSGNSQGLGCTYS